MKVVYAKRVPPGDRWQIGNETFDVDAGIGEISIDDGKEAPKPPPKTWDLYGERSEV